MNARNSIFSFPFLIFGFSFVLAANAGHVSETLAVSNGWNAVYIESTPDDSAPGDFFADMPSVRRVGCYESSVFGATEQIVSDGTVIDQKPVSFYVWERGKDDESTLRRIMGGRCYFIYAEGDGSKTFYGVPGCPSVSWQAAGDGFMTIAGVSIPAGETVSSSVYFKEGPLAPDSTLVPYAAAGDNPAAPIFEPVMAFRGSPELEAGRAYAFGGKTIADWPGVVKVSVPAISGVIAFGSGTSLRSFSVSNAGTTNRTVRVAYGGSEKPGEAQPSLKVYIPRDGTNEYGWTEFSTHDFELGPGESKTLVLSVDKTGMTAEATFGGLVTVSDLSGTKMRLRIPVTAEMDADTDYSAMFPKGLWYGNIELSQVDGLAETSPVNAGGRMKLNAILLVDGSGAAHLMQRVAVATSDSEAEDGTREMRLWPDVKDVPVGYSARRLSAVFPDVAHNSLPATGGEMGGVLQFDWTVEADARDNPFRHAWHPDHKTGFAVTNRLALAWRTETGESTWRCDPDEITYGICTWTLGGLSGAGDITTRGTFALKRILPISKVED